METNHLLFITTDFPPDVGGLQEYSREIVARMRPETLREVFVATGRDIPEECLPNRETVKYRKVRAQGRVRVVLSLLYPFLKAKFSGRIAMQLHMQWSTSLLSYLWNRCGGASPYFILIHGTEFSEQGRPFLHSMKRRVFAGSAGVVAGSHYTLGLFRELGYAAPRETVIPYGNPLEDDSAAYPPRNPPPGLSKIDLLCLHRLVARKGTSLLLEALADLKELPWALVLVGNGPEKPALEKMAVDLDIANRIEFKAPVNKREKVRLLREASLFVLPSLPRMDNDHVEGLGLSLLEAQSLGLAVLAARTGGIPEAVQDGRTGWLFEAGNGIDLREKLRGILERPEVMEQAGAEGPRWVREHFSWKCSIHELEKFISASAQEYFSSPVRRLR